MVGDGNGFETQALRLLGQRLVLDGAVQKAVIGVQMQVNKVFGRHTSPLGVFLECRCQAKTAAEAA